MSKLIEQLMRTHGFDLWQTGGGCTAYGKTIQNDCYWMITVKDDASAPTSRTDEVMVGFYNDEGDCACYFYCRFSSILQSEIELPDRVFN